MRSGGKGRRWSKAGPVERRARGGDDRPNRHLVDEGQHAAAESASGHPGAVCARSEGGGDGGVDLGHGDLEVVAHRGVRRDEDRADPSRVRPRGEERDDVENPRVLGDDVA